MADPRPVWPTWAKFTFGQRVRRCDLPSGKSPSYRFRSTVCGWYDMGSGNIGYVVAGEHEPGNKLIFPEYMLEAIDND